MFMNKITNIGLLSLMVFGCFSVRAAEQPVQDARQEIEALAFKNQFTINTIENFLAEIETKIGPEAWQERFSHDEWTITDWTDLKNKLTEINGKVAEVVDIDEKIGAGQISPQQGQQEISAILQAMKDEMPREKLNVYLLDIMNIPRDLVFDKMEELKPNVQAVQQSEFWPFLQNMYLDFQNRYKTSYDTYISASQKFDKNNAIDSDVMIEALRYVMDHLPSIKELDDFKFHLGNAVLMQKAQREKPELAVQEQVAAVVPVAEPEPAISAQEKDAIKAQLMLLNKKLQAFTNRKYQMLSGIGMVSGQLDIATFDYSNKVFTKGNNVEAEIKNFLTASRDQVNVLNNRQQLNQLQQDFNEKNAQLQKMSEELENFWNIVSGTVQAKIHFGGYI